MLTAYYFVLALAGWLRAEQNGYEHGEMKQKNIFIMFSLAQNLGEASDAMKNEETP